MSAIEMVSAETAMPRLSSVEAVGSLSVSVVWAEGNRAGKREIVDLSPLVGQFKLYAPLRTDPGRFATIKLADDGGAVEWAGGIDMAASSIERLAEEQMTAQDFEAFLKRNKLTRMAAASALGRSLRMIQNYLEGESIPRVVALACRGYEARTRLPDIAPVLGRADGLDRDTKLYEEVGRALSKWSFVEEKLSAILTTALNPNPADIAGPTMASFWAVVSFDARLKMVDSAVKFRAMHSPDILDEWKVVCEKTSKRARQRAELAHGTVIGVQRRSGREIAFVPSMHKQILNTKHFIGHSYVQLFDKKLDRNQIANRATSFIELYEKLDEFHAKIYDKFAASYEK